MQSTSIMYSPENCNPWGVMLVQGSPHLDLTVEQGPYIASSLRLELCLLFFCLNEARELENNRYLMVSTSTQKGLVRSFYCHQHLKM